MQPLIEELDKKSVLMKILLIGSNGQLGQEVKALLPVIFLE